MGRSQQTIVGLMKEGGHKGHEEVSCSSEEKGNHQQYQNPV